MPNKEDRKGLGGCGLTLVILALLLLSIRSCYSSWQQEQNDLLQKKIDYEKQYQSKPPGTLNPKIFEHWKEYPESTYLVGSFECWCKTWVLHMTPRNRLAFFPIVPASHALELKCDNPETRFIVTTYDGQQYFFIGKGYFNNWNRCQANGRCGDSKAVWTNVEISDESPVAIDNITVSIKPLPAIGG